MDVGTGALTVGSEHSADPYARRRVAAERVLERIGVEAGQDSLRG